MLSLFRALTNLRESTPALQAGSYRTAETGHEDVFAFVREESNEGYLVALNFSDEARNLQLTAQRDSCEVVLSTNLDRQGEEKLTGLTLRGNEGIIVRFH